MKKKEEKEKRKSLLVEYIYIEHHKTSHNNTI